MTPMRIRSHPGKLLKLEIEARKLAPGKLAQALAVPPRRIADILRGRRSIDPDTAIRLGRFFGNDAQFWMDLQTQHDLSVVEAERGAAIAAAVRRVASIGSP
jgi:addiction module HigA family antidote